MASPKAKFYLYEPFFHNLKLIFHSKVIKLEMRRLRYVHSSSHTF